MHIFKTKYFYISAWNVLNIRKINFIIKNKRKERVLVCLYAATRFFVRNTCDLERCNIAISIFIPAAQTFLDPKLASIITITRRFLYRKKSTFPSVIFFSLFLLTTTHNNDVLIYYYKHRFLSHPIYQSIHHVLNFQFLITLVHWCHIDIYIIVNI